MLDDLRKHDAKLKLAEKNALKRLIRLLQKSRTEVIGSLMDTPSEWTETTLLSTLRNIDLLMLELKSQLGIEFDTIVKDGAKKGFKDENDLFEKFFSDKLKDVSNSLLFGVVELTVLKTLETNVDEFLIRFTAGIRERIKNTIQQGFINGRGEGHTIQMLKNQYDLQMSPLKRAVHQIYQVSYNTANHEVLQDLARQNPDIKKQWISFLDAVTTSPCLHLNDQIQEVNDPFIEPISGSEFMYPPACFGNPSMKPVFHYCRSRSTPYIEGYD